MARYLVAIDYSSNSVGLLRYAHALADHTDNALEVAHVVLPSRQAEYPADTEALKGYLRKEQDRLAAFQKETIGQVHPQHILKGFATEALLRHGQLYDLIMLGAKGVNTWFSNMLGSTAVAMAQRAVRPVEIIPEGAEFQDLKHILLAVDDQPWDDKIGEKLASFNRHFGATVHILHVRPEEQEEGLDELQPSMVSYLEENLPELDYRMELVSGDSAAASLMAYAEEHPVDLLVLINQRRGFWNHIFHRGTTAEVVLHSQKPVLVFHR